MPTAGYVGNSTKGWSTNNIETIWSRARFYIVDRDGPQVNHKWCGSIWKPYPLHAEENQRRFNQRPIDEDYLVILIVNLGKSTLIFSVNAADCRFACATLAASPGRWVFHSSIGSITLNISSHTSNSDRESHCCHHHNWHWSRCTLLPCPFRLSESGETICWLTNNNRRSWWGTVGMVR